MSSESLPQQSADSSAAEKLFAEQMAAEREYVARVYARLDELREETAEKLAAVIRTVRSVTLLLLTMRIVWRS